MIKDVTMYYCVCDSCNKDHTDYGDPVSFPSKEEAKEAAISDGWIDYEDKMYCPDCIEYDDKDDCYKPIID